MIWIGKRVIRMGKFVWNFCRNFTRVLLLDVEVNDRGMAMDFAWWTRSTIFGHWPRDGIRMRSFRLHVYECWLRSYWKRRRGYDPCTPTTFVSALSFLSILSSTPAEWDENQNKRALPPPKAAKHSLKYILKYILFREPGNRNLTFIPRGNNTTPFEKTFVQHDSSSPKFFSSPWKRIYPNNVRILYEYQRIIIIVPTRFPQFFHSKLRNNSSSTIILS